MKILSKEETGRTIYYAFEAELNDGKSVEGQLIVMWDDDNAVPSYEMEITNKERELSDKEEEELENLVINK